MMAREMNDVINLTRAFASIVRRLSAKTNVERGDARRLLDLASRRARESRGLCRGRHRRSHGFRTATMRTNSSRDRARPFQSNARNARRGATVTRRARARASERAGASASRPLTSRRRVIAHYPQHPELPDAPTSFAVTVVPVPRAAARDPVVTGSLTARSARSASTASLSAALRGSFAIAFARIFARISSSSLRRSAVRASSIARTSRIVVVVPLGSARHSDPSIVSAIHPMVIIARIARSSSNISRPIVAFARFNFRYLASLGARATFLLSRSSRSSVSGRAIARSARSSGVRSTTRCPGA